MAECTSPKDDVSTEIIVAVVVESDEGCWGEKREGKRRNEGRDGKKGWGAAGCLVGWTLEGVKAQRRGGVGFVSNFFSEEAPRVLEKEVGPIMVLIKGGDVNALLSWVQAEAELPPGHPVTDACQVVPW